MVNQSVYQEPTAEDNYNALVRRISKRLSEAAAQATQCRTTDSQRVSDSPMENAEHLAHLLGQLITGSDLQELIHLAYLAEQETATVSRGMAQGGVHQ